jgi:cytochrome c553
MNHDIAPEVRKLQAGLEAIVLLAVEASQADLAKPATRLLARHAYETLADGLEALAVEARKVRKALNGICTACHGRKYDADGTNCWRCAGTGDEPLEGG